MRKLVWRVWTVDSSVHAVRNGQVEAVEGRVGAWGAAVAWAGEAVESVGYSPEPRNDYDSSGFLQLITSMASLP